MKKLTYQAQNRFVDPAAELDALRAKQNEVLKKIIEEEREAEAARAEMKQTVEDDDELASLDLVFAEERRRANQRIIAATKEHEAIIKSAVLKMMNLQPRGAASINNIGRE